MRSGAGCKEIILATSLNKNMQSSAIMLDLSPKLPAAAETQSDPSSVLGDSQTILHVGHISHDIGLGSERLGPPHSGRKSKNLKKLIFLAFLPNFPHDFYHSGY